METNSSMCKTWNQHYFSINILIRSIYFGSNCKIFILEFHQIMLSFSFVTNFMKLFTVKPDVNRIEVVHGLRFWGMFFTIMAHTIINMIGSPTFNSDSVEYVSFSLIHWTFDFYCSIFFYNIRTFYCIIFQIYTHSITAGFLNGPVLIDTFYTITGFLASFLILDEMKRGIKHNYLVLCIHRIIRFVTLCKFDLNSASILPLLIEQAVNSSYLFG